MSPLQSPASPRYRAARSAETTVESADIVVIGGGCIGTSIAYHLAKRKAGKVLLLERNDFLGTESTGKCAGGIRAQFSTEVNVRLSLLSIERFERWEEEMHSPLQYRQWGYLFLLTTEELEASFRKNFELWKKCGMMPEWLSADDVAQRFPYVNMEDVRGATFHQKDGFGDPNDITQGFAKAARDAGVQVRTGVEVTGLDVVHGRRITGVVTNKGKIATQKVVLATGAWTRNLAAKAGVDIPIEPFRRQIITTDKFDAIKDPWPMTVDLSTTLYCHRESGGVLIGMSNEQEPPSFNQTFDEEYGDKMLATAMHRIPLLEQASPKAKWAGLYETTPDHHPVIDKCAPVEGLFACAGFSGHGLMHAPAAGVVTAELVLDGKSKTLDLKRLRLSRFTDGSELSDERNVI